MFLLYYVSTLYTVIIHMMAGRIDDEKLYKRGLNHEPTKSVSTLIISFNWISPSFSDLMAIVLSHSRETLTLANNSSENLIFLTEVLNLYWVNHYSKHHITLLDRKIIIHISMMEATALKI